MTHICVGNLTIIGSDNGLSPGRRQAIIRTNAGILLIRPLGTNFSEFLVEILIFSFKKMRLKVSSAKRRTFCLGLNVLKHLEYYINVCRCPQTWISFKSQDIVVLLIWNTLSIKKYNYIYGYLNLGFIYAHQTGNVPLTFPEGYNQVSR